MKKSHKNKDKQPFNINISFNINPKNVTQTQHNAHTKVANNIYQHQSQSPHKYKASHHNSGLNHFNTSRQFHKSSSKQNNHTF